MSFVLSETDNTHLYWHKVKIRKPIDNGFEDHVIRVRYRAITQDRVDQIAATDPDQDLLLELIQDWEQVNDEAGNPVPYNADNLRRLLGITYVKAAIWMTYLETQAGGRARRGN